MNFRQIHLDFHTSEAIEGIGAEFTRENFREGLQRGRVNHINLFAKCHHGWAYFPSEENEMHPHLGFDLLGEMLEVTRPLGVTTPIYVSVGFDQKYAVKHPEDMVRSPVEGGGWNEPDFGVPGYKLLCLNTKYLGVILRQIDEVARKFGRDGVWLDIVAPRMCLCEACRADILARGEDILNLEAVKAQGERVYAEYCRKVRETLDAVKPGLSVFHNGGHITRGRRDLMAYNSNLELESLPTGGWGYDHFPLSARYAQGFGGDFLSMTGKFHTTWGEFGGYKHVNALRYEAALAVAHGAKVNIGDQLHPRGKLDTATYSMIGRAYGEIEAKEPWLDGVANVADVALLSAEACGVTEGRHNGADVGAVRMLAESHLLFDVLDTECDFAPYKVIILPDVIRPNELLAKKLREYVAAGGQVLATGESGLFPGKYEYALDFGVTCEGENPYQPDYFRPGFELPELENAAVIFYSKGVRLRENGCQTLAWREDPYFNRAAEHFCSHQHTPSGGAKGGPGMAKGPHGIVIPWRIFEDYASKGSITLRWAFQHAIKTLLCGRETLVAKLPSQGRVTLQRQTAQNRLINHLLYASPIRRGAGIEVIEDLIPLYNIECKLRLDAAPKRVYLAPQNADLPFKYENGTLSYVVAELLCHQMVVIEQ